MAVESISLDMTHDLDSIPVVCKTEEVHTEELLVEEVSLMTIVLLAFRSMYYIIFFIYS